MKKYVIARSDHVLGDEAISNLMRRLLRAGALAMTWHLFFGGDDGHDDVGNQQAAIQSKETKHE